MHGNNLPPGVTPDQIPGNRPENIDVDQVLGLIAKDAERLGLDPLDMVEIWERGLTAPKPRRRVSHSSKILTAMIRQISILPSVTDVRIRRAKFSSLCKRQDVENRVGTGELTFVNPADTEPLIGDQRLSGAEHLGAQNARGCAVAVITVSIGDETEDFVGQSICSASDRFDADVGCIIALRRAARSANIVIDHTGKNRTPRVTRAKAKRQGTPAD